MFLLVAAIVTRRRSIAKNVGRFCRNLFVCLLACLFVNTIISEQLNTGWWNLAVDASYKNLGRVWIWDSYYYYYKCQDLSDAITTVAGALYKVYPKKCYTTPVSMAVHYQSAWSHRPPPGCATPKNVAFWRVTTHDAKCKQSHPGRRNIALDA